MRTEHAQLCPAPRHFLLVEMYTLLTVDKLASRERTKRTAMNEEKLILLVEQNLMFYEHRHPHHKDLNRKKAAWLAIAGELGVSSKYCKLL